MTSNEYPTLMHRWFEEVWNQGRTETIDELLTDSTIHHGLSETGEDLIGIAPFKNFHSEFLSAFSDLHVEVKDVKVDGEKYSAHFVVTGTQTGDLRAIAATGKKVRFDGGGVCEVRNGKCIEIWNEIDFGKMQYDLDPNTPNIP